ncbi:MAG TPA: hypothetical protein VE575_15535 [Acidimicrobiales bacterium]|jgi:hypothetical protein|nr:hypothetical protein [Acidimicrobiales bacterium]
MHARDILTDTSSLQIRPWLDPIVDQVGYDPRSRYVERFWLGILGPSATWLMRYLVDGLERSPDGFALDLDECATALGLGRYRGSSAAFPRTIARCCQFGAGRLTPDSRGGVSLEVRRRLPPLTRRQVRRLSPVLQAEHARWVDRAPAVADDELREQARRLALSLLELGEGVEAAERQLHRWRFSPALASEAIAWAVGRHTQRAGGGPTPTGDARPEAADDSPDGAHPRGSEGPSATHVHHQAPRH